MRFFLYRFSDKPFSAVSAIVLLSHILLIQGVLAGDAESVLFEPDPQDLTESVNDYNTAETYDSYLNAGAPDFPDYKDNEFPKTSYADWNQGYCSNCWVWSGTAAVAQSYKLHSGNAVPISVQFFNSNYFDGNIGQVKPHDWACTSGTPTTFVNSYNAGLNQNYPDGPFVIPWSNTLAGYADFHISDAPNATTQVPKDWMSTTPHLRFTSMEAKRLVANSDLIHTTEVINNLTEVLAEGNLIVYTLYFPDAASSKDFVDFSNYASEDTLYDPSGMDGKYWTEGMGHAMVIVGYNRTDANPDNQYWIVQDSYGTRSNRPTGQFRLKMNMNYNASYYYPAGGNRGGEPLQQFWKIDVHWASGHDPVSNNVVSGDSGGSNSYTASSPRVSAGQSMYFAINEPVTSTNPVGIVSVVVVPNTALGPTDLTVADSTTADNSAFVGRQVASIESINLVGVIPSLVQGGTITFAVSGSWMRDHGVKTEDIVMMRDHDGTWAELPATFDHVTGDTYYFTAATPGFSSFAVATRLNSSAAVNATAPAATTEITSSPTLTGMTSTTTTTVTTRETLVPQTTAVPAPASMPSGSSGIPVLWAVAGIAAIAIAAVGGFLVRRWWIHRQNPALFRKYD
jgi:Predicted solute binding protein